MNAKAIGPLTGILFVVLAIVAFIVSGETPDTDDSTREIVNFYLDNDTSQGVASALLALGCVALATQADTAAGAPSVANP